MITCYNKTKGKVDVVDKLCASYTCARNTRRWLMVIFYSIFNVAGINSCIIYNENNSSKINRRSFLKKLFFELIQEQLEERAACPTLPSNVRAKICKFSDTRTDNAPQKGKHGRCQECQGKIGKLNTIAQSASNSCIRACTIHM